MLTGTYFPTLIDFQRIIKREKSCFTEQKHFFHNQLMIFSAKIFFNRPPQNLVFPFLAIADMSSHSHAMQLMPNISGLGKPLVFPIRRLQTEDCKMQVCVNRYYNKLEHLLRSLYSSFLFNSRCNSMSSRVH